MNGGEEVGGEVVRPQAEAAIRRAVAAWRRLTTPPEQRRAGPGAPTLVAVSGGADSSALAIALARAAKRRGHSGQARPLVLAHVMHDMRPEEDARRDRDAALRLAESLSLALVEGKARCRPEERESTSSGQTRNLEARARTARYAALAQLAREAGAAYVATAHHADDQLETLLMSLLRGGGWGGMSGFRGIAVSRGLADGVQLIRPLLDARIDRAGCEAICAAAGWAWADDATNRDLTRLRAAVRSTVVPAMKALRPGVARLACTAGELGRDHLGLIEQAVKGLRERTAMTNSGGGPARRFARAILRDESPFLIGALIRGDALELTGGSGADAMTARALAPVVRAIRDRSTDPRTFAVGPVGVEITAQAVTLLRRDLPSPP